jgi:hypothetical protein
LPLSDTDRSCASAAKEGPTINRVGLKVVAAAKVTRWVHVGDTKATASLTASFFFACAVAFFLGIAFFFS